MDWNPLLSNMVDITENMDSTEVGLYNSFLKRMAKTMPIERGLVYILDENQEWLICRTVIPSDERPFWRCFSLNQDECIEVSSYNTSELICSYLARSTVLDDRVRILTKRRNVICIPLKIEQQMDGVICLEFSKSELTVEELELIKLHTMFLILSIERNRYKEQLDDISGKLYSFHHSITAMNYTTQYEEIIRLHLAAMIDFINAHSASLMLVKDGRLEFEVALEKGNLIHNNSEAETPLLEEWVLNNGIPFFIDTKVNVLNGLKNIVIPLISKKEPLGTITIRTRSINNLSESNRKLLGFCTSHLARVIDNYNLFCDIQLEKSHIESILNSSPLGLLITDINGMILAMNRSAANILNLPWSGFIVEYERLYCPEYIMNILENRNVVIWPVEVSTKSNNHTLNHFHITATEVSGANNLTVGFTVAMQNVTEKRELEKQVERVNKLASLGSVAAGVAHEIRNPLMSLSLFLDEIHDNITKKGKKNILSNDERNLLEGALKQIDRLDKIVSTLLNYATKEKKEATMVDLNEVIEETMEFIRRKCEKSNIVTDLKCRIIPKILIDEQKLKQALLNIYLNAIQAMQGGGTLKIRTGRFGRDRIRITIADTGCGISKNELEKIFSPFFSTKEGGIGLGLSITEKLVTELGGTINVSSKIGCGTEFALLFHKK